MPALFGFILGVMVTIAGAYLYDSSTGRAANGMSTTASAPMVNWNVVTDDWHAFATGAHQPVCRFNLFSRSVVVFCTPADARRLIRPPAFRRAGFAPTVACRYCRPLV